jgi:predicted RNA-binding Zn ribbon-like protein
MKRTLLLVILSMLSSVAGAAIAPSSVEDQAPLSADNDAQQDLPEDVDSLSMQQRAAEEEIKQAFAAIMQAQG